MNNSYSKTYLRIKRRLNQQPRLVTINALLFTLFTVVIGLFSKFTHHGGTIHGGVYWVIFGWSVLLALHAGSAFLNSGAWRGKRERIIQEEVLDAGEIYDLSSDELVDLHLALSETVKAESAAFKRLALNALGNLLLWPGILVLMLVIRWLSFVGFTNDNFGAWFNGMLVLAMLGTGALGLMLPVRALWQQASNRRADLHRLYGGKRKRKTGAPPVDLADMLAGDRLADLDDEYFDDELDGEPARKSAAW